MAQKFPPQKCYFGAEGNTAYTVAFGAIQARAISVQRRGNILFTIGPRLHRHQNFFDLCSTFIKVNYREDGITGRTELQRGRNYSEDGITVRTELQ